MSKHKAGLQKEVSSIFDGVPMPKGNGAEQPPDAPTAEHPEYGAPSPLTSTMPKPQEPTKSPPKAAMPKQPKAYTTIKTTRQIPGQQIFEQIKNKLLAPKPGVSATKQKAMVILVPVLFIVLIFVFIRVFSTPSRAMATTAKLEPIDAVASSNGKIDWQIPALYPATLRDPMQFGSVTTAETGTGRLAVKGIVYSEDKPAVIIGTEIVCQGDKVLGATIVKINKNSVEFEMNGKKWTQKVQ
jgi:hypothetical protein